jgi:hypothetical protein
MGRMRKRASSGGGRRRGRDECISEEPRARGSRVSWCVAVLLELLYGIKYIFFIRRRVCVYVLCVLFLFRRNVVYHFFPGEICFLVYSVVFLQVL